MIQLPLFFVIIWFYVHSVKSLPKGGCSISINKDLGNPQPLILRPEGGDGNDAFYLPKIGDSIILVENQVLILACPNSVLVLNENSTGLTSGQAICTSRLFTIKGIKLHFKAITCKHMPFHIARYTGNTCVSQHREIEIGFAVNNRFLRQILVCFDLIKQHSLYSEYNLTKTIAGYQRHYPRPKWTISNDFYNTGHDNLNTLYTRRRQRYTINKLLGLEPSSYKYISESGDFYLARGHLAAKADFLYGSQQRLTFYYANAAPQWQTFNGRNWMYLESNVRGFASDRHLDLIVYTGTYGIATLPHETTGQDIELFLYVDVVRGVPVPRLYWKVLYEPISKAGAVFLGVNNPYIFNRSKDVICTDICSEFDWLTWDASNVTFGYSYCCTVDDFKRTVTTLPDFKVVKLLK